MLFSAILIVGGAALFISRTVSKSIVEQQIYRNLETVARSRAKSVEAFLELESETARQLSGSTVIRKLLLADKGHEDYVRKFDDVQERLRRTAGLGRYTYALLVLNKGGIVVASTHPSEIGERQKCGCLFPGRKNRPFT